MCGDQLTIGGEQPSGAAAADTIWQRRERPVGAFSRSIGLPWEIDSAKVEARLRDGVLTITLPKSSRSRARKVAVQTA